MRKRRHYEIKLHRVSAKRPPSLSHSRDYLYLPKLRDNEVLVEAVKDKLRLLS